MKNKSIKELLFIGGYLVVAYLAYGWVGVFWAIPLVAVVEYGLWSIAWTNREKVIEEIKRKLDRKNQDETI